MYLVCSTRPRFMSFQSFCRNDEKRASDFKLRGLWRARCSGDCRCDRPEFKLAEGGVISFTVPTRVGPGFDFGFLIEDPAFRRARRLAGERGRFCCSCWLGCRIYVWRCLADAGVVEGGECADVRWISHAVAAWSCSPDGEWSPPSPDRPFIELSSLARALVNRDR